MNDEKYMQIALDVAVKGEGHVSPNPLVGAVIVKNGEIISKGYHHYCGGLHAERDALKNCREDPEGAEMYVTLEPCCHQGRQPPCTQALIESGIKRVVVGCGDPNPLVAGKGSAILREHGIEVKEYVLEEECKRINEIFFYYIQTGLPFVTMKYAMTADGKIATKTGASKWITSEEARELVHDWRNACRGIMAGIGTVLADDPLLNCRRPGGRDPVRIICDSRLRIPEDSQICRTAQKYETIVACALSEDADRRPEEMRAKAERLRQQGVEVWSVPAQDGSVDLKELVKRLGKRGIDSILLEGGGTLNESALRAGIVQEVNAFVAPKIFGGKARSPVEGTGVEVPQEALQMEMKQVRQVGKDLLITYRISDDQE